MKKSRPLIGLTMGDPAGIGPEICLAALREPSVTRRCIPVLFGDAQILRRVAGNRFQEFEGAVVSLAEFEKLGKLKHPLIVDCAVPGAGKIQPGKVSRTAGRAGYIFIEQAIRAAMAGKIAGVATAPIHKESLRLSGVLHPGHTEIFTALTGTKRSCMMLYSKKLTVSMVTTHIGYREVPEKLSTSRVLDVIELTAEAVGRISRRKPCIGVCGLNPHAGEHGLFGGREEEKFVIPAVRRARSKGINACGPLVPDAVFTDGQRRHYDAIVTLYHDQGHIPFKMLAFETGVNVTLGLPIIRTSVDHGTAFDIAWQNKASPSSMYAAIGLAVELAAGRKSG